MKRFLMCVLLLPAVPCWPQAQNPPPATSPSPESPPTPSPAPRSAEEQRSQDEANRTIQDNVADILKADPVLDGAQIQTTVDDEAITLTGTVRSEAQHQRALELVHPYTRWRKVVDKITVR